MTDRIPGAPGRCKAVVTGEDLQKMQSGEEFAITLRRNDAPIEAGTPYNKASVLPDELAEQLCPELQDPAPKDAFAALQAQKADTGRKKTGNNITIKNAENAPLMGMKLYGGSNATGDVVGFKGSITVNLHGKNIADVTKLSADSKISTPTSNAILSNSRGTTISATEGNSVTVTQSEASGTATSYTNGYFSVGFYAPLKVGDVVTISFDFKVTDNPLNAAYLGAFLNGQQLSQSWVTTALRSWTVTITEGMAPVDNWNSIEIRVGGKSGVFSNFQIEYGSAYTGYEPYKQFQTLTIPTTAGEQVGLEGDDQIRDEIDLEKGLLIHRFLEKCEYQLPADVLENYKKLRTFAPATYITNDEAAEMEVRYCTNNTAVPMVQNVADRGKVLAIDNDGTVSGDVVKTYVNHMGKSVKGWTYRVWDDGFAELFLTHKENSVYGGAVELLFTMPLKMSPDTMIQVTVPGKIFCTDYTIGPEGEDLTLYFESAEGEFGEVELRSVHVYVAGYMIQ